MENYELKRCKKCGEIANLYGEGLAKTVYENGKWDIYFTDFDGYRIECENCINCTKLFMQEEDAVKAWNEMNED